MPATPKKKPKSAPTKPARARQNRDKREQAAQEMPTFDRLPDAAPASTPAGSAQKGGPSSATKRREKEGPASIQRPPSDS